jgi:hypothetical protein
MNAKNKIFEAPVVSIVDDDISVRRSTLRLLRSSGLRAEPFASAGEFLQSSLVEETDCRNKSLNGWAAHRRPVWTCAPVRLRTQLLRNAVSALADMTALSGTTFFRE